MGHRAKGGLSSKLKVENKAQSAKSKALGAGSLGQRAKYKLRLKKLMVQYQELIFKITKSNSHIVGWSNWKMFLVPFPINQSTNQLFNYLTQTLFEANI
jgi:hypothetical protein